MVDASAASALGHLQTGSIEWHSDHDLTALHQARLDDYFVSPGTWRDYVLAFMIFSAPVDSLMRLVRKITSSMMENNSSTDEFSFLVRGIYRWFYAEAKRTRPPNISLHLFSWEQIHWGPLKQAYPLDSN